MVNNNKLNYYIFIDELNKIVIKNIIILKKKKINLNIIISPNNHFTTLVKFAKAHNIPFFIYDNVKFAIKNNAKGIFLSSKNRSIRKNIKVLTKLEVIGSAHNQIEYYFKKEQNCSTITLSPIFLNPKYSQNQVLNIQKFNIISLNWMTNLCALGGINKNNFKKIMCTRANGVAFNRAIKNPLTT